MTVVILILTTILFVTRYLLIKKIIKLEYKIQISKHKNLLSIYFIFSIANFVLLHLAMWQNE